MEKEHDIYPNGDVNPKWGVCTDLVIRAVRYAGIDLQKSVYEDIADNPLYYRIPEPNRYIEHRRVRVLLLYFRKNVKNIDFDFLKSHD